jgi:phenylpyruvate tautomerase PptA (4-oxalocrotonate tautomerase family)
MPTYVCSFPPESLSDSQKDRIAHAISRRHAEATGAPRFFVQVVIDQTPDRTRFLGGHASDAHVWIRADIRAGRSKEVRQQLMLNIMKDVAEISGVKEQDVWVYINNLEPTDMVEFGHILPAPGEEQKWFESLPAVSQTWGDTMRVVCVTSSAIFRLRPLRRGLCRLDTC